MKTVEKLMVELSNFPVDKTVRFFNWVGTVEVELKITEYDQDESGNPTFFLEEI